MGRKRSGGTNKDRRQPAGSGGFRIPSILMVPVGLSVGWMAGDWLGAVLGGVIGFFLWRSRA
jgi:hypothetical protein